MNEIVTVTEFCEKYGISSAIRKAHGWDTDVKRVDASTFYSLVEDLELREKRPVSYCTSATLQMLPKRQHVSAVRNMPSQLPPSRSSVFSIATTASHGSVLDSSIMIEPISLDSILQSEYMEMSILDSELHMTTQSSPPPDILSSVCDCES